MQVLSHPQSTQHPSPALHRTFTVVRQEFASCSTTSVKLIWNWMPSGKHQLFILIICREMFENKVHFILLQLTRAMPGTPASLSYISCNHLQSFVLSDRDEIFWPRAFAHPVKEADQVSQIAMSSAFSILFDPKSKYNNFHVI